MEHQSGTDCSQQEVQLEIVYTDAEWEIGAEESIETYCENELDPKASFLGSDWWRRTPDRKYAAKHLPTESGTCVGLHLDQSDDEMVRNTAESEKPRTQDVGPGVLATDMEYDSFFNINRETLHEAETNSTLGKMFVDNVCQPQKNNNSLEKHAKILNRGSEARELIHKNRALPCRKTSSYPKTLVTHQENGEISENDRKKHKVPTKSNRYDRYRVSTANLETAEKSPHRRKRRRPQKLNPQSTALANHGKTHRGGRPYHEPEEAGAVYRIIEDLNLKLKVAKVNDQGTSSPFQDQNQEDGRERELEDVCMWKVEADQNRPQQNSGLLSVPKLSKGQRQRAKWSPGRQQRERKKAVERYHTRRASLTPEQLEQWRARDRARYRGSKETPKDSMPNRGRPRMSTMDQELPVALSKRRMDRAEWSPERLQHSRQRAREYYHRRRAMMTPEQLQEFRVKSRASKRNKNATQMQRIRQRGREGYHRRRAAMTPEQLEQFRAKGRAYELAKRARRAAKADLSSASESQDLRPTLSKGQRIRAKWSPTRLQRQRQRARERYHRRIAAMTPKELEEHRAKGRAYKQAKRAGKSKATKKADSSEGASSSKHRHRRQARERCHRKNATMTPEQLEQRSDGDRKRCRRKNKKFGCRGKRKKGNLKKEQSEATYSAQVWTEDQDSTSSLARGLKKDAQNPNRWQSEEFPDGTTTVEVVTVDYRETTETKRRKKQVTETFADSASTEPGSITPIVSLEKDRGDSISRYPKRQPSVSNYMSFFEDYRPRRRRMSEAEFQAYKERERERKTTERRNKVASMTPSQLREFKDRQNDNKRKIRAIVFPHRKRKAHLKRCSATADSLKSEPKESQESQQNSGDCQTQDSFNPVVLLNRLSIHTLLSAVTIKVNDIGTLSGKKTVQNNAKNIADHDSTIENFSKSNRFQRNQADFMSAIQLQKTAQ